MHRSSRMPVIKLSFIYFILPAILFLSGCGAQKESSSRFNINEIDFTTLESGLKYGFLNKSDNPKPEPSEILILNMLYFNGDTVIFDTRDRAMPVSIKYRDSLRPQDKGTLYEGFQMLKKGDSVAFQLSAKALFEKSFNNKVPGVIEPDDVLTIFVGVEDVLSQNEFRSFQMEMMRKREEKRIKKREAQMKKDSARIEEYFNKNNITNVQHTASGVSYVIHKEGKKPVAKSGDSVKIHYKGTLLDGTKFDASYDRNQSFSFVLGQGRVIPGWEEGIAGLKEGTKATLYIPSPMAYGEQSKGAVIKPNSILKFEIDIIEVSKN